MAKEYEKKVSAGKPSTMRLNFQETEAGYEAIGKLKAVYSATAVREIINDLVTKFLAEQR